MKKAVIVGERRAQLVDVPDPKPRADWALVKVQAAPMCTEYKSFLSGEKTEFLGHEAAGEVVEVAQPGRVKVGDRVVVMPQWPCGRCEQCVAGEWIYCRNNYDFDAFTGSPEGKATYAQYLLKPGWLLPAIPDGVSYERASLACCALGPSFGAMEEMHLGAFDTLLVTGAGPVGLGAVVNALFRNARVILVESVPWRIERAREMGVRHVVDPRAPDALRRVLDLTGGRGVDCALDCAGVVEAERLCIEATRRRGTVAFVGECGEEMRLRVSPDLIRKGLTVVGSWMYSLNDFPKIMHVIEHSPLVELLLSHILPMSGIQEAFEISASHECAKIILKPWE
jgi:threonine dehydrogenase-like Zn-dependent dehydrogenase